MDQSSKPRWPALVIPAGISRPKGKQEQGEESAKRPTRRRAPSPKSGDRKRPPPDVQRTMELLKAALVKHAALELPEDSRKPSMEESPYTVAWTYKRARGAPDVAGHDISPNERALFAMARPELPPPPEDKGAVLSDALHGLACMSLLEHACPAYLAELVAWRTVRDALERAIAATEAAQQAPMVREPVLNAAALAAIGFRETVLTVIEGLEGLAQPEDFWAQHPEDRRREAFGVARLQLMEAFTDTQVARLTDDGKGGEHKDRVGRVKQARRTAQNKGDFADLRIPHGEALFALVPNEP